EIISCLNWASLVGSVVMLGPRWGSGALKPVFARQRHAARTPNCALPTESKSSHHLLPETINAPVARNGDQPDLARLAGLEADGCARRDIEAHAAGFFAIETEARI